MLFLCALLAMTTQVFAGEPDTQRFKLVKQDDILSLYERWIPGKKGEKIRELKAVFQVRTDISSIVSLLRDPTQAKSWNSGVLSCAIQPSPSPAQWLNYVTYDIPWPFDNQDCLLSYHLNAATAAGDGSAEISFHSVVDKRFPVPDGFDRISGVQGKWMLTAEEGDRVKITYLISTDRSKQIPRWISDPVIHRNVFNTMTAFKQLLEKRS